MNLPYFYLQNFPFGNTLALNEETSRHVVQVLRMACGEKLQLTNGEGLLVTAEIIEDHKKKCLVSVIERAEITQPNLKHSIAISLVKNNSRFEWFLEKATEIGISEIVPIICERTEKTHFRYERMNQIIISAMLQSKQAWLPKLHEPLTLEKAIQGSDFSTKLIAHCLEEDKLSVTHFKENSPNPIQIYIGPEGDFTKEEISIAIANNCKPISLGKTRLRTETAGVVAATLLCI